MKEAKKVVNLKKKTLTKEKVKGMLIAKEKEKGLFEKEHQEAAGHNSGPLKQSILLWIRV